MEDLVQRVKKVGQLRGKSMKDIAAHIGITYSSLYNRLTSGMKLDTLRQIADFLECDVHELIPTGVDYAHFYDKKKWLGIRRKY